MGTRRGISRRGFLKLAGGAVVAVAAGGFGMRSVSFAQGRGQADAAFAAGASGRLANLGSVKRLSILPLIEWFSARDDLATEAGLSYLVRADDTTILLDVGLNLKQEHPSPLLRNAAALGVDLADLDALFITHPHTDHLGGGASGRIEVMPSGEPVDFRGIPAYLPSDIPCPATKPVVVDGPHIIAPGVASLGVIPRQDFVTGWVPEHSLAVNVEGKGVVVIVGCGHSTTERILERADSALGLPVYGIVGGLHFPVTASRLSMAGIPMQRIIGTGKWPWDPIGEADVQRTIDFMKDRNPALKLVSLSAHDSCDWTLGAFKSAFGDVCRDVKVGQEIVV